MRGGVWWAGCGVLLVGIAVCDLLCPTRAFAQSDEQSESSPALPTIHVIAPPRRRAAPPASPAAPTPAAPAEALTSQSTAEAQQELDRAPDATTLLTDRTIREGAVTSGQDAFTLAPGVSARTATGGQDTISMRGSGILNDDVTYGIRMLRDGIPLTRASGFGESQDVDFFNARYLEIYRGASAMRYGAASLGGAINMVTYTGYDADPFRLRFEGGSFNLGRMQVSSGKVLPGGFDYYASFSGINQDGFRDHSREATARGFGNVGYRWDNANESRIYVTALRSQQQDPGPLSLAELKANPRQAQTTETVGPFNTPLNYPRFNAGVDYPLYRVDFKHSFRPTASDRIDFGVYGQTADFTIRQPFNYYESHERSEGFVVRGQHQGSLAGHRNALIWGFNAASSDQSRPTFAILDGGARGDLQQDLTRKAQGYEAYAENQWWLTQALSAVAGAQATYASRSVVALDHTGGILSSYDSSRTYQGASAKAGLVWQAAPALKLFGSVATIYEPPNSVTFYDTASGNTVNAQTATSYELGARVRSDRVNWDVTLYHSVVKDEILSVETPPGSGNFATSNAVGRTVHDGVEVGVEAFLPLGWLAYSDRLRLAAVYNYMDFHFVNDPSFGNNRIPAVSMHNARGELFYMHSSGVYFGPTFQFGSGFYADFANTLKTDSYALVGLKGGYKDGKGLSYFIEGRNLTNVAYASSVVVVPNAQAAAAIGIEQLFRPGQTRAIFAGMEYRFAAETAPPAPGKGFVR